MLDKKNNNRIDSLTSISTKKVLIIATLSVVFGVIIFTVAYLSMKSRSGLDYINQPILSWMINHRFKELTDLAKLVTSIAGLLSVTILVATISAFWLYKKREIWRPLLLVGSIIASSVTSLSLKSMIMDLRPPQVDMIPAFETDYSFPSGHTIIMAVFLLVIGYLIYSRRYSNTKLLKWSFIAAIGTGIIAISRLYLGYHWLTDVVASFGLGLIIFALTIFVDFKFKDKFKI